MVWMSDAAGTTMVRYSPVSRAMGVTIVRSTGALLVMIAPIITMPPVISALPSPEYWLMNCGRPMVPPAPPTLVIRAEPISPSPRRIWSITRAVWSQPPPGAAGTKISSEPISCASVKVGMAAIRPMAPVVIMKFLRFMVSSPP